MFPHHDNELAQAEVGGRFLSSSRNRSQIISPVSGFPIRSNTGRVLIKETERLTTDVANGLIISCILDIYILRD